MRRRQNHWMHQWWWSIDRAQLAALIALMAIGSVLVAASGPAVAERINLDSFYFIRRQQVFLVVAFAILVAASLCSPRWIKRLSLLGLGGCLLLMLALPFIGTEIKGATRWVNFLGVSLQPSEFLKPFFAVTTAWIFTRAAQKWQLNPFPLSFMLFGLCITLLIMQPDFGMSVMLSAMWGVQVFLAGLPLVWVLGLMIAGGLGGLAAYHFLPHVTGRIDRFLNPETGDNYQVDKSLEAFGNGGFFGKGPGEGQVKLSLPDSHTDFIFAVAGEEFGLVFCLFIVGLYGFIVAKIVWRLWQEQDYFVLLATSGLLTQFGLQALVNMGVAVQMFPAKGMTLPFLSYGGSSAVSMGVCMGMILALTRKRL